MEKRYFKKNGEIVWINLTASLVRDTNNNPDYFIVIIENITEKRLSKETLIINELRYQKAQALGHVGNWEYHLETAKIWASDETKRIYGFNLDTEYFTIDKVEKCIPEKERVHQALIDLYQDNIKYDLKFDIITHDKGIKKTINSIAEVERDALGNPIKIVGVIHDITEQNKIEEQLRQSRKMDAIGQLAGGVAHDFNNMLTVIIGCTDVMALEIDNNQELKEYLDLIIDSSLQASELTQKLLSFSRKAPIAKELFDVHKSINKVSAMLKRSIDKRIEIIINLNANTSWINGDKSQIQNTILNVGINARDSMPEGGKLIFTTNCVDFDTTENEHEYKITPGKYIEIDIEDTGVGMSNEVKTRVFEPFFTTKGLGKGTGLGLSVAYNTIKENKGSIDLYSEMNKGTVVKIYLPIVSDHKESKESIESIVEQYVHGNGCILVVDDERAIRITVGKMLRELGYEVLFAVDGLECLKLYKEKSATFDLVILDVVMPRMNGQDVFYALKEINPDVKVLMSSGYAHDINTTKLIKDGASGFIQKPYRQIELSKKVAEVLA